MITSKPKYPEIEVQLVGLDGNAFAILGRVLQAMRRGEVPKAERMQFQEEAMSDDYNHLLQTVMKWVSVS